MLTPELKAECKKLVDRARHGDQNAMGMIERITLNAKGGIPLAQASHQEILSYTQGTTAQINGEVSSALSALKNPNISPDTLIKILCLIPNLGEGLALHAACVILSKGPLWPAPRVAQIQSIIPPPAIQTFQQGLAAPSPSVHGEYDMGPYNPYYGAGSIIGCARRIQGIVGGSPLCFYNPNMGWELD